jgi:hypothetical protein
MFKRKEAFRFELHMPIIGNFQIKKIDGKYANSKPGTLKIHDISPDGMKFISDLDIPLQKEVEVEVQFKLNETAFNLNGKLVWRKPVASGYFYGVSLKNSAQLKKQLVGEMKIFSRKHSKANP